MSERDVPQEVFRSLDRVGAWPGDIDQERVVEAWVVHFDEDIVGTRLDGEAHPSRIRAHAVDRWLRTADPRDVEARVDHEGEEIGCWFEFRKVLNRGVMGSLLVEPGWRGDRLLEVLDQDPSWGFSFAGQSPDWTETETDLSGMSVTTFDSLNIRECGPTPQPADEGCYVVRIGGRPPRWRQLRDVRERDELVRQALGQQPRRAGGGIH